MPYSLIPQEKRIYAHTVKLDFLTNLLKPWKKRNNKLLHIGIHNGIEPIVFWDMGFDVTALAQTQEEFEESQAKNGKMIEYIIANKEHLPLDEKAFDYVVLTHSFSAEETLFPHKSSIKSLAKILHSKKKIKTDEEKYIFLQEAFRVCAKSICLIENNSFAFNVFNPAVSPFLFREVCTNFSEDCENSFFSALTLPSLFWSKKQSIKSWHALPLRIPFGSFMAVRIDKSPLLMTSLPLTIPQASTESI